MQIHATNINGLGASQVIISFLDSFSKKEDFKKFEVILPTKGILSEYVPKNCKVHRYKRFLPNSLSRAFELLFSRFLFKNRPTIVLGDIPLRGIENQIVLVHQPNLIYPSINSNSGKSIKFKVNRFLFKINQKFAKKIVVQTSVMAEELIASYPKIKNKVVVLPQPVPNWLKKNKKKKIKHKNEITLFYPSAFYPHKKHDFLIKINEFVKKNSVDTNFFKIYVTLKQEEFQVYQNIDFVKNLGRLNKIQMNKKYQEVDCLLFLSSAESYGLPLAEAIAIDLPILCADFKYSRWMCENFGYYFVPYEVESFLKTLNKLKIDIKSDNLKSRDNALKKFPLSWDDVVQSFQNLLHAN